MKIELLLKGPAGEPVDLWRTIASHGVASLPPLSVDEDAQTLTATVALPGLPKSKPRTVTVAQGPRGRGLIEVHGADPPPRIRDAIVAAVRHVLSMDRDLSGFYRMIAGDPDLSWAASGAGRMIRSQTVFEEVVKTICTTNCTWSATVRMVTALVEHLGEKAPDAPASGAAGRAFPTPQALAAAPDEFYRSVAKAGYRGAYIRKLAEDVLTGATDVERLARSDEPDDVLYKQLLVLPGVGPYAAAHVMTMLGRSSRPILDSWSRPKFAKLAGKKKVSDAAILRRFARYKEFAGLAFWLYVTQDWVPEGAART